MKTCSVVDCDSRPVGRGLCNKHWLRWRHHGTTDLLQPTLEERFWAKVTKTADCWIWTGSRKADGYGRWRIPTGSGSNGPQMYTHRVAWEWANGPIPEGRQLDHICHNTSCVRPDHLRVATPKENQEHRVTANKGNRSGVRGVTWNGSGWSARVRHAGQVHYAGSFKTISEAEAAVVNLRRQLFTHSDMDKAA